MSCAFWMGCVWLRAGAVAVVCDRGGSAVGNDACGGGVPAQGRGWRGRGCAGIVGGGSRRSCKERHPRLLAVRVLRAGLDGGLAGSGDVAGAAGGGGGGG